MTATNPYRLSRGNHSTPEEGRCAMEWVAYLAGEPHTDKPVCVSPALRGFCIVLNDHTSDYDRQKLRPYLARMIGTVDDGFEDERRQICREWLFRTGIPTWLEVAGRADLAAMMRSRMDPDRRFLRIVIDEAGDVERHAMAQLADAGIGFEWFLENGQVYPSAAACKAAAFGAGDFLCRSLARAAVEAGAASVAVDALTHSPAYLDPISWGFVANAMISKLKPIRERHTADAFALLDRMLPKVPVDLPADVDRRAKAMETTA